MRLLLIISFLHMGACDADVSHDEGERLAYALGCINCHHQTPKELINAPSLLIAKAYTFEAFSTLLRTGRTASGLDLLDIGSVMGIVAVEQFSYLTGDEVRAVYNFLRAEWSEERALAEEAKIPLLYKETVEPDSVGGAVPSN